MLLKAFRLFVSSTFADFVAEREVLHSKVFPALDTYCTAKGYQFHAIDLRWGVSEEAQLDQRTADICLGEVRAARGYPPPNFFIMLGNRYGWVPLPYAIARDEFEAVLEWLGHSGEGEALHQLAEVYRLDENQLVARGLLDENEGAFVGAYTLKSRDDEIPELKRAEAWTAVEANLRRALQGAADGLLSEGRIAPATREKYFLSLTEQEIRQHLVTSSTLSRGSEVIAFVRELATPSAAYLDPDPHNAIALRALKARIEQTLADDRIVRARATRGPDGSLDSAYLQAFAAEVEAKVRQAIDRHVAKVEATEQGPDFALHAEREAHRAFRDEKLKVFVGRQSNLAAIAHYLADDDDCPLVLYGRSGQGKTALMARAAESAEAGGRRPIITRFIGASAASSDLRALLVSVVEDLAAHRLSDKPAEYEQDANKFTDQIKALLSSISEPVVIFLDALDQLQKPFRIGWLPEQLPAGLKVVLSVLDDPTFKADSKICRNLKQRLPPKAFLAIEPLKPADGREILLALEELSRCRLQDGQRDYILSRSETTGTSPLYLRTAFEIANSWRSWDKVGEGRCVLAEDTAALITQLVGNLAVLHHHEPKLVSRTLGYLAAAKDGLSAKELTEILSRDPGVMQAISSERYGARTDRLPPSVWARLERHLAPFLIEKRIDERPLLHFFHRQMGQVALDQHYEPAKTKLHSALAAYFDAPAMTRDDRAIYHKRSLSELPYQLHHAQSTARLGEVLMSPDWMQQKIGALGPQPLIEDYQYSCTEGHEFVGKALKLVAGILAKDARQLLPQLDGRLAASGDASIQAFRAETRKHLRRPAILSQTPSLTPPGAEIARLEGHTNPVKVLMLLQDGRLASGGLGNTILLWDLKTDTATTLREGCNTLVELPDGRLASGSKDNTIRIWDSRTYAETARLRGHTSILTSLSMLPDGKLASSAHDGTILLWDLKTYAEAGRLVGNTPLVVLPDGRLACGSMDQIRLWDLKGLAQSALLEGHTGWVTELAVLSGSQLASRSQDGSIRIWDLKAGVETARFEGHKGAVSAMALLPDGKMASSSDDGIIRLWDLKTGTETARLAGHASRVGPMILLPDNRLASGSDDKSIRIWDLKTGAETARLEGHSSWISSLAALPDDRLASGAFDNSIRLWDLGFRATASQAKGHSDSVVSLAVLPDGRLASGSRDHTIRIWNPTTSVETARLESHTNTVSSLAVLLDGRLASGSMDHTVRIWNPLTCAETARLEGYTDSVTSLVVLLDGRLASGDRAGLIRLWELMTGAPTAWLQYGAVEALAQLPDGRLVSSSLDDTIRLWEPVTGAEVAWHRFDRLKGRSPSVYAKALLPLPDGRLASGLADGTIRLLDLRTDTETCRLEGHTDSVMALTLLPSGSLASGSLDKTVRVWDLLAGKEIMRLDFDAAILCLATLIDGRLVAGDQYGRLHWLEIMW